MSRTGVGVRVLVDGDQLDDGCLPWSPYPPGMVIRRNLSNHPVPRGGVLGWNSNNINLYPVTRVTDVVRRQGTTSARYNRLPASPSNVLTSAYAVGTQSWGAATRIPVAPGDQVTASVWVRCNVAATVTCGVQFLNVNTGLTFVAGTSTPLPANTWVRAWVTAVAPANATNYGISQLNVNKAGGAASDGTELVWIQDAQYEDGGLSDYFDGSFPSTPLADYDWEGNAGSTPSVETAPLYSDRLPQGLSGDDGLKITWGRSDTVSQPTPSTCSFRVVDSVENQYFQSFNIGSSVRILADAMITGGATVPAFTDPDFETELRAVTFNARAIRDSRHVETGTVAAVLQPINMSSPYRFQLPPGALQTPGTNPNAWDGIPHLSPGETWHMQTRLWVPDGVEVTARLLVYSGPYADAVQVGAIIGSTYGGGDWVTLEADVSPGVQLGWLGLQVEASGGQAWEDVPDAQAWATTPTDLEWRDLSDVYVDRVTILAPPGGTTMTQLVFGGRITDMEASWGGDAPILDITATDFLGDMGNRYIGDEPWVAEPLSTRLLRVLELAQVPGEQSITADIATTVAGVQLSWEDVDHRAASGLLTDMANSVDGVLWSATHVVSGPYVRLEDPAQRPALYQLGKPDFWIEILPIDPDTLPPDLRPLEISACDVLRDPVQWVIDVSDIATRSTVTWQEQTLDDDGQPSPTERTLAHIDQAAELTFGTRNISLQTMLTNEPAAQQVAERLLARNAGEWRLQGLVVADIDFQVPDQLAVNVLMTLLDGVRRGGMAIRVVDLPVWSPLGFAVPAYVEGGEYTYTGGGWELALTVSRGTGLGRNAQWDQLDPTWTWDDWNPGITWDDLRGVAAPGMT